MYVCESENDGRAIFLIAVIRNYGISGHTEQT